jgi:hypothetical protein
MSYENDEVIGVVEMILIAVFISVFLILILGA